MRNKLQEFKLCKTFIVWINICFRSPALLVVLRKEELTNDRCFCFFPVCFKVYNCQAKHLQVRKDCIDFMRRNREKFEAVKYFDSIKSCLHKKKFPQQRQLRVQSPVLKQSVSVNLGLDIKVAFYLSSNP